MPKVEKVVAKPIKKKPAASTIDDLMEQGSEDPSGLTVALYGRTGTGKTRLYGTFPKPLLSIVCSSIANPGELKSMDRKDRSETTRLVLRETTMLGEIVDHQRRKNNFRTIALDHGTGLQDLILKEILELDELPAQLSWGIASQQDWGQTALKTKEMLRAVLNLANDDTSTVIVAQEREFETPGNLKDVVLPNIGAALTPGTAGWLATACDYVVNTFTRQKVVKKTVKIAGKEKVMTSLGGIEFCLRIAPHPTYATRFRVPRGSLMPDVIVDPSYDKIKEILDGNYKG